MARNPINSVEITPMTSDNSHEAFSLACKVFVNASVLHTAMDVTFKEYREYMRASFEVMWKQGLSIIATDTNSNELIGCLVACDYQTQTKNSAKIPNKLKPVIALLRDLEEIYLQNRQIEPGQFMLVDMAVVKPEASGRGIYRKLREKAHQIGREAGFRNVVGELSSAATQHLCINRFGHKVCAEIEYTSFNYLGRRPFAAIKEPPSIILVEGDL